MSGISEVDIEAMTPAHPEQLVVEFIKAFGASLDLRVWYTLVEEELEELYKETPKTKEHLKELCDLFYVTIGMNISAPEGLRSLLPEEEFNKVMKQQARVSRAFEEYAEVYGGAVFLEAFYRVHESNMSKLGADGKPIHREDGKVLKGPNYKKPDLSDLMDKLP
jgi:hypothetical protein